MLRCDTQEEDLEFFEVEDPEGLELHRSTTSNVKIKRQFISEEYAVRMCYVDQVLWEFELLGEEVQEAFASHLNHRFASYWTKEDNSFRKVWTHTQLWINAPFTLMDKVVLKLLCDEVQVAVVVAPVWKSQMWWPVLCQLSEKYVDFPVGTHFFEYWDEKANKMQDPGPLRWPVRVSLVNYRHYRWKIWEGVTEEEAKEEDHKGWSRSKARSERRKKQKYGC